MTKPEDAPPTGSRGEPAEPQASFPTEQSDDASPTLEARQLTVRRHGAAMVEGVSFKSAARRVALVGDGSFLARLLVGEAEVASGEVLLMGTPAAAALSGSTRLVPRDGWLLDDEPVLASLRFVAELFRVPHGSKVGKQVLGSLGLSAFARSAPAGLEPAERTAVSLAMALVTRPRLLVLEQPLDGLDDLRAEWLRERIEIACRGPDAPRLVWSCERLLTAAAHELASSGDVVWLQYGQLLGAASAGSLAAGSALCLVRVAGDGQRLKRALTARGVVLESTDDSLPPKRTSTWRMHASARQELIRAAVETETPVLDLQLIKPLLEL